MRVGAFLTAFALAGLSSANAQDAGRPNSEKQPVVRGGGAAGCDIAVHPAVVLKAGQQVNLTWTIRNADSAIIVHDGNVIEVEQDKNKSRVERPSRTTTYTMFVPGAKGTAKCQVSVAVPERTQPAHWPPPLLASMPAAYLDRARASLMDGITNAQLVSDRNWTIYAIASLLFEQDMERINKYFAEIWPLESHTKADFGLFSLEDIRLYGLFNGRSGAFPGRLGRGAQRNLEEEFFKVASLKKPRYAVDLSNVWKLQGSENHSLVAWSSHLLASQFLKNSPAFANRAFEDGRTAAEHYASWRNFWSNLLDERARRGMYMEVGSPTYEKYTRGAFQNIRDFSEDPVLRQKAEMLLDLTYALIAQETLANGVRGGAKSRVYSFRSAARQGGEDRNYNLLFEPVGFRPIYATQASSSYFPPPVIWRLGRDPAARGQYRIVQRGPGMGQEDRPGGTAVIDPNESVVRYSFVTPSYILGSFVHDPDHWVISSQNRWQGVVFNGDLGTRIAPQITRLNKAGALDREQRVGNGFTSTQDRNVLITQRSGYDTGYRSRTDIYISGTLDLLDEEEGWIFVKEGSAFGAVHVVHQGNDGYRWLDQLNKNKGLDKNSHFVTLTDPDAPIIIVANEASDYGNDFEKFKSSLKAQRVKQEGGTTTFAGLTFYGPKRGGIGVSPYRARTYDSPFIRSQWASGAIYIRQGREGLLLDLSTPEKPLKRVVEPALTPDFPNGVGEARPIVFQGG
ncbi:MAG: hypothetical protein EPO10_07275 [Reyranella sp.]|uniref:hypothetical protein n=1 Tax=Reyranella sp. TaxID=1929291 RepID=UPI001201DC4F|nr:hypothetical protein [Reyranella sp.]TAJ92127.1 MAG: hypothetical protein EPO41_14555 [Reyranella sp.]TBR29572.1 MAG: hypothetical protein EPO10_07275 [Reyranella sp.]